MYTKLFNIQYYVNFQEKKMDVEHYETERKGKDTCGLKKLQTTTKQKNLFIFYGRIKLILLVKL